MECRGCCSPRPKQVLAHDAQGLAGQGEGRRNGGGLRAQKQHVAGLLRQIGAGAHGDACVGLGQRGGVVDAVAHHGDAQTRLLQGANARQLAGGIESRYPASDLRSNACLACAIGAAAAAVSPVSISTRRPARRSAATASAASGRSASRASK